FGASAVSGDEKEERSQTGSESRERRKGGERREAQYREGNGVLVPTSGGVGSVAGEPMGRDGDGREKDRLSDPKRQRRTSDQSEQQSLKGEPEWSIIRIEIGVGMVTRADEARSQEETAVVVVAERN